MRYVNTYLTKAYVACRLHFGVKIATETGVFRLGMTPSREWVMWEAAEAMEAQREYGCRLLNRTHRTEIHAALGRNLTVDEVRMSFQPEFGTTDPRLPIYDGGISGVFVDDVAESVPGHIMIETSPGNWQAHFFLSRGFRRDDDLALIQRYLRQKYSGDHGAVSARHPRRFASPSLEAFIRYIPNLNATRLLAEAKELVETDVVQSTKHIIPEDEMRNASSEAMHGVWNRALGRANGDRSCADFALGLYLAARQYEVSEIIAAITEVRGDEVFQKHYRTADAYLEHTAARAIEKVSR